MSDVSSISHSSSASGSPGDQILAEDEDSRMAEVDVESQDDHVDDGSMEVDEEDATEESIDEDPTEGPIEEARTEDQLESTLPVESTSPQPGPENEAEPGLDPEAEAGPQPQSESQPEPEPESHPEAETQSQIELSKEADGTAGQPYSVDEDTAGQNNDATSSQAQPLTEATPTSAPNEEPQNSANGQSAPDAVTDGRVKKNPVPNKYIAKATKRDGNFGVMQMGHGRAFMDARDLAAKRSSEATQQAAEQAVRSGHNGMARRKHVWKPADPNMTAPPPPGQYSQYQQHSSYQQPQQAHYPPPPQEPPMSHPSPELKNEQARLLTFLRSLHPVIVVDQLCKALAYFGGIPGAPAPQDWRAYPQSARGNGAGGLMVGWMSEIFPPADFTKPPFTDFPHNLPNMGYIGPGGHAPGPVINPTPTPAADPPRPKKVKAVDPNAPPKRPRGRPKGSKNSKFRKDKGARRLKPGDVPPHADGTPWRPGDTNPMVDLTQDTNSSQPAQPPETAANQPAASAQPADATPVSANQPEANRDSSVPATPGSKRKGRPKGSKTRVKPVPAPNLPPRAEAAASAPGPQESPLANVARAATDATGAQYESPYASAPAQKKPVVQETALSQHAQGWADPPAPSPRVPIPDSALEPVAQPAPPPDPEPVTARPSSKVNNSRKRKQQHAPLVLPTPLPRGHSSPAQPEHLPQQNQPERHQLPETTESAQAKRRRTANVVRPASAASHTRSQSQSPALSTSIASNNATPTPTSASFGTHAVSSRAPTMRPSSGQMPQQHYQPPAQQEQYQRPGPSQSPPLNSAAENNTQTRQGPYSQQPQQPPQQGYYAPRQDQQYAQANYQSSNNNNFGGPSGANGNQQFSYDTEYVAPNAYALSARRAMEDAASFNNNQSMYGQFGRR